MLLVLVSLAVRAQGQGGMLKSEVLTDVKVAQEAFLNAKQSLAQGDFAGAKQQFTIAEKALHRANSSLAERGQYGGPIGGQASGGVTSGTQLLASGELAAQSAGQLSADLQGISDDLVERGNDPYKYGEAVVAKLPDIRTHLRDTNNRLKLLARTIDAAKHSGVSGELATTVNKLDSATPELIDRTEQAERIAAALPSFLGADRFKQYLVWFQNPAEIRGTGGFIGTYGRLTLNNGAMKELLIDGIYNIANQSNAVIKERAPAPYVRFAGPHGSPQPPWALQDSNWSPNFPTSAQKFQQFYEKSGGPTTDGVIAITLFPIVDILRQVGPIEMPEHGVTFTADNFQKTLQADQESKAASGDANPKQILHDFTPKLLDKISHASPATRREIFKIVGRAVSQREIQAYFNHPQLERMAEELQLDGQLTAGPNTLSLVDTNIGGRKSSTDIKTTLHQEIRIDDSGQVTVTVTGHRDYLNPTSASANLNYSRLFVPKGSVVTNTDGYEGYAPVLTDQQDGFTVIGGWTTVYPGETRGFKASYRLPKRINLKEGVLPVFYGKQSGTAVTLITDVTLPPGYLWTDPDQGSINGPRIHFEQVANTNLQHNLSFRKP